VQPAVQSSEQTSIIVAAVLATISTIFPGFLVGALSVQISDEFAVSEETYGWGFGAFFLAATIASVASGKLAQRVGPRRQVTVVLIVSALAQLGIAFVADSFTMLIAFLAIAGLVNAANQSAINLLLSQARLPRLGLAIALKQSGMPTAALLGGLAVPALALTLGWRSAYVVGATATLGALINVRRVIAPVGPIAEEAPTPITAKRVLVVAAVGFGFMAFAAGALNAWTVSSGVESGLNEGIAGLLLSLGAGIGIAVRLMIGVRIDRTVRAPLKAAAGVSTIGAIGMGLLAIQTPIMAILATVVAFGAGWVWPVFTNYGVVRTNLDAAGAATGVTQTGVYIGVFCGPLLTGAVIEWSGYSTMWLVTAAAMFIGLTITATVSSHFTFELNSEPSTVI
jgi:MFS family permease